MGSVGHNQEWRGLFYAKIQHTHDMRMIQVSNSACLYQKIIEVILSEPHLEEFDGGQCFQIDMLTKIDFSETTSSEQTKQAIISNLLSQPIDHVTPLLFLITAHPFSSIHEHNVFLAAYQENR